MSRSRIHHATCTLVVFLAAVSNLVTALQVSPSSPCASKCLDNSDSNASDAASSTTSSSDLACHDWEYVGGNSTQAGQRFSECNNCIRSSGYQDTTSNERDVQWFLFNNRATVDWCVFGRFGDEHNENVTETEAYKHCNNDCSAIYAAADLDIMKQPESYGFCDNDGNFTADAGTCLSCLRNRDGLTILGNILATVQDLCQQKPDTTYTSTKDQEIYTTTPIQLAVAISSESPSPSTSPSQTAASSFGGLSKGVIAGIVLGVLVIIAVILGAILFLLRLRKNANKKSIEHGEHTKANANGADYGYDAIAQSHNDRLANHSAGADAEPTPRAEVRN